MRAFSVPILANPNRSTSFSTVNLTLSQTGGGATLGSISSATLTITNNNLTRLDVRGHQYRRLGPGHARARRSDANADHKPGVDNIVFDIPASTAAEPECAGRGFDPITQTWTITLELARCR